MPVASTIDAAALGQERGELRDPATAESARHPEPTSQEQQREARRWARCGLMDRSATHGRSSRASRAATKGTSGSRTFGRRSHGRNRARQAAMGGSSSSRRASRLIPYPLLRRRACAFVVSVRAWVLASPCPRQRPICSGCSAAQPYCIRGVSLDRAGTQRKARLDPAATARSQAVLDEAAHCSGGHARDRGRRTLCACRPSWTPTARQGCTVPQPVKDQDVPPNELARRGRRHAARESQGIQRAFRRPRPWRSPKEQAKPRRKSGFGACAASLQEASCLAGLQRARDHARGRACATSSSRDEVFAHAALRRERVRAIRAR